MIGKKIKWYERDIFSTEEKFKRTLEIEECKDLIYRKMYYYNSDMREEELDEFWVKDTESRKTASLASPWGFYVGFEDIRNYYVVKHDEDRKAQLAAYAEADPHFKDEPGYGASIFRVANTPVVYIAEDGQTAQGMWFLTGEETIGAPRGKAEAYHLFGRAGVDFKKEADAWKIWHWAEVYDLSCPVGEKVEDLPLFPKPEEEPFRVEFESGGPTIKMITHFFQTHSSDGWPPFPCAHSTYNLDNSYGPEAHPEIRDDCMFANWESRKTIYEAWGR